MKILFYIDTPFISGAEAQLIRNIKAVSLFCKQIYVLISVRDVNTESYQNLQRYFSTEVEVIRLRPSAYFPKFSIINFFVEQLFFLVGTLRGIWYSLKLNPKVIHVNSGGYPGAASARGFVMSSAFFAKNRSIFFSVNNIAVSYKSLARWADAPFDLLLSRLPIVWITGSRAASESIGQILRVPARRRVVIPNGVPRPVCHCGAEFKSSELATVFGKRVALSVGHLEPRKGHLVLIKALKALKDGSRLEEDWVFLIEGAGALVSRINEKIKDLGLESTVHLLGRRVCIAHWLERCDLLIHPSVANEDLPNVISEAMSLGKPIISSKLAGIPSQIDDGVNGYLTDPGDFQGLAEAIAKLMIDPEKMRLFGLASQDKYSKEFTVELAINRFASLYGMELNLES